MRRPLKDVDLSVFDSDLVVYEMVGTIGPSRLDELRKSIWPVYAERTGINIRFCVLEIYREHYIREMVSKGILREETH